VEGEKLINEAINAGFTVERVYINSGALSRGEAVSQGYPGETALEEKLFLELARTETPGPYIAVVAGKTAAKAHESGNKNRLLILDRINDPGNAGTIIRAALAAGMDEVLCLKGTADIFSDKAVRASAGAIFHIPVIEGLSAEECLSYVKEAGLKLFVCEAGGNCLFDTGLAGRIAIVIGNESRGPQAVLKEAADTIVGIPMAEESESLNAASAASVVMYEALRQRMKKKS